MQIALTFADIKIQSRTKQEVTFVCDIIKSANFSYNYNYSLQFLLFFFFLLCCRKRGATSRRRRRSDEIESV